MNKIMASVSAAGAVLVLTACGSSGHPAASHPAAHHTAAAPPAAQALTCGFISGDLSTVLHDLTVQDRHLQEAWVSGGDAGHLKALMGDTQSGVNGANTLNDDAATFNQDASQYLADNSPYLAPGWQQGYDQVTADINALAADCGQPGVKPNTPANS